MKFTNIVKIAGVAVLVACLATGCQNKKKAEAEARARAEAEARARAEAEAAALAARVFVISPEVTAAASDVYVSCAEEYQPALESAVKGTAYGSTTLALPGVNFKFGVERCGLTPDHKALMTEFVNAYNQLDKSAVVLVEPYAADVKDHCYNRAIAVERAERVVAYLQYLGIPANKICKAQPACGDCKSHQEADHKCECGKCKAPQAREIEAAGADKRCCRVSIK